MQLDGLRRGRFVAGLLLAVSLWGACRPAVALDPPLQVAQYAHTSWTARDGAVLGLVFAMAQTPDGYLWIAGSFGLFRFDGVRFEHWQPPDGRALPSGPYSLLVSRDGTLWIGTFSGLSSWDGRKFVYRYPQIGERRFVTSLLEDRDGTVWAGVLGERGDLCAIRAGQVRCDAPGGRFGAFVWSLAQDGGGALWVGAESGVWRWNPGEPRRYPIPGPRMGDLTTTADGNILAGMQGGGLLQASGDRLVPYRVRRAGTPDAWLTERDIRSNKLMRDRDGGVWVGTAGNGIIHIKDGRADMFTRADGLSGNVACSLFEDREGNIWFGSDKGLDRFRKLPVTLLSTRQGLPDEATRSALATRDGSLWVATGDGLARWSDDGTLRVYTERDGLPDARVGAQYQDVDGRLWVSTGRGLAYLAGDRFVAVAGAPGKDAHSITGDGAGNLWLSWPEGVDHLYRGRLIEQFPLAAFRPGRPAQNIVADRGGLWLSFWNGELLFFKDGKVEKTYRPVQAKKEAAITDLRVDSDGTVWASTGAGGLSRIQDGRATALTVANGLPCDTIHWSMRDDSGSLWLYAACGLVRVTRDDLAAWIADPRHRVDPTLWGATDGVTLANTPAALYNPPVAKDARGKLWFVGTGEVQLVDPAHLASNPVPPPVHIEALVADRQSFAVASGLALPALTRDITIEFAALTLTDPKSTRFRYRLEGHDDEWQEVVDRRVVTYTNLPPGNYRFRVRAANNSGVWNDAGAQLDFSILPAIYQRTWFRGAMAVVLLGLVGAGFHARLHMRVRRIQLQFDATLDARVAERTRIARELHDTLLQSFHGLLLQLQAGINLLPDRPQQSRQVFTQVIDQVANAITEGRDAVQALRASVTETNNLSQAVRSFAHDLANERGNAASVQVDVHGTPQLLHPLVRDETFRIAAEALRNAYRHAEAKRIDVQIRYEPQELVVLVRDDGKGIDPEVLSRGEKLGHFGLGGMHERAKVAGGSLAVRSAPGAGTQVQFSVPGSRAYGKPAPARSWIFQKLFPSRSSPVDP